LNAKNRKKVKPARKERRLSENKSIIRKEKRFFNPGGE